MTREKFLPVQGFLVLLAGLLLAACGGSSDSAGDGMNNPAPVAGDCDGSGSGSGSGSVTISGHAEYEFVPAVETSTGAKLDYAASEFRSIRAAEVQAVCAGSSEVFASTVTDDAGAFSLVVPGDVDVEIRVRAAMTSPAWDVRVVDNTREQSTWSAQGDSINSGTENFEVTLRVPSGWDGSEYSATRAAAPFAILDSVYIAMQKVLSADPDADFPALKLNWSPDNRTCTGEDFPFADGCIGTSFYANYGGSAGRNIFILGDAGNDTDEYDNHVILHEWGHYYEDVFSRSDSIGGAHGGGDILDPRVAFGEGWGNAFSGIATDDAIYVDTRGTKQGSGFAIDVENSYEGSSPGWWNEGSVQAIIYDLYDDETEDAAALGFDSIHDVLTGGQRTTEAMTTVFSFIHFLKQHPASVTADIRSVVASHDIAEIVDEWGSGRANGGLLSGNGDDGSEFGDGFEQYATPYKELGIISVGEVPIQTCTTNRMKRQISNGLVEENSLGARRLMSFAVSEEGRWRISMDGERATSDPDFYVWLRGAEVTNSRGNPNESGADFSSASPNPDGGDGNTEIAEVVLSSGDTYVLEVMDYLNVDNKDTADDGVLCLDISFEKI